MKAMLAVIVSGLLAASLATAQLATAPGGPQTNVPPDTAKPLSFDVISVKPSGGGNGSGMRMNPDGFSTKNVPAHMLLTEAFQADEGQVLGEPDWARTMTWDIDAKVTGDDVPELKAMSFDQRRSMVRQVLEERFGLKVHHETRDLPVYALVVAKGGPKLTAAKPDPDHPMMPGSPGRLMFNGRRLEGGSSNMQFLAVVLARPAGRKVIDKTGLTGRYDFVLTWGEDEGGVPAPAGGPVAAGDPAAGESIFTALEEQLGLKLEPVKAPVDVVVIDHLEKPSEN
jgi:uncharacterized protein (TIGR03435 family)